MNTLIKIHPHTGGAPMPTRNTQKQELLNALIAYWSIDTHPQTAICMALSLESMTLAQLQIEATQITVK